MRRTRFAEAIPSIDSSIARVTAGGEEEPHVAAHRPEERQVAHDLAVDALLELVDAVVHPPDLEGERVVPRFDRLKHHPFPGGRLLRTPALVLGMAWYRLRDLLG